MTVDLLIQIGVVIDKYVSDSMAYNSLLICGTAGVQETFKTSGYVQEAQVSRRLAYITVWHFAVFKGCTFD